MSTQPEMQPEMEPRTLSEALTEVRADRVVVDAVTEAAGRAHLEVLRTGPGRVELGSDPAKEFALLVQRSHVDLAVGPDVARDHAQRFGFVRQRSNGRTTVIRVAASQLAIAEKRAVWADLVEEAVTHRSTCPDRVEPRVATTPTRAARPARPTRSSAGTAARTTRQAAAATPPAAPLNLCPVHGTEMLGGLCDRCD
ncbi:hypothetical protein KLP28_13930 [Nocardioidaceae bacterium]|nr:hypothetical protein KLP28_13930 [Nocardioidaceae bacterium]